MTVVRILKLLILFAAGVFTRKALSSPYRNNVITAFSLLSAVAITIIVPKLIIKNAQAINEIDWLYKQEYEKKIDKLEEEINVLEEKNSELEQKNSELEQKNSVFGIAVNIITYILGLLVSPLSELIGDGMKEIRQRRKRKEEQEDKEKEKKRKKKKKKKKR